MTARRVLAVLLLALTAGCGPRSDYRVPDSGAVWVTPSTYPAPGPCGGVR